MKSKFDCFVEVINEHMNPKNTLTVSDLKDLVHFANNRYEHGKKKDTGKKSIEINEVQEIQMRLMEIATFNNFNGKKVVELLRSNKKLWDGFVFTRLDDLIFLRDIRCGDWNVDTLYILVKSGMEEEIERLADLNFDADEISWIGGEDACKLLGEYNSSIRGNNNVILRCWWD
jgi:hypothetical protein